MERNSSTQAVVIGTAPFGETHRKVKLLSPSLGLIDAVVYGGRKGKKTALAPLFSYGTFSLYFNPVNNEYSITDEAVSFIPQVLNSNLGANCTASFFCEVAMKLDSQDYSVIYPLICSALTVLENRPDLKDKIIIAFTWKLLIQSGIQPDLSSCPICDKPYKDDDILGYSSSLNAPVCRACADLEFPALLPGCRRFLKYTSTLDFMQIIDVEVYEQAQHRIKSYLLSWLSTFCSRSLKTLESGLL